MISLLVAYLALFNRWLDDGGTVANFYDKPGLTHRLQGNVEFMRNFGLEKKQFISCRRCANICPFQQKITWQRRSPWSQYVFQDLQRKREECLGKVIRFFTVSTSRSRLEHLCVLTDHQKKNIETFPPSEVKELPGIWDVCLFMKSESFDTFGPHTCLRMRVGNQPFFQGKNTFQPSAFVAFCLQGDV